jgi:hypothetical protein
MDEMNFRAQIFFVLLLTASLASTVFAQTAAEKDAHTSQVASLLATKTDSTDTGGLVNPAAYVTPSASEEFQPTAIESHRNL